MIPVTVIYCCLHSLMVCLLPAPCPAPILVFLTGSVMCPSWPAACTASIARINFLSLFYAMGVAFQLAEPLLRGQFGVYYYSRNFKLYAQIT